MPDSNDDLFGEDENEAVDEFDRLSALLFERISEVAEQEDVPDELLPLLLLRLAVSTRMMAYATSVAKPSSSGLKLDLDRFRQDAEQLIRGMKKEADAFIAHAKEAIAATEPEDDET
ncbi:MAG TPA: hypothetical protein VKY22_16075 [Bradyrhizobium sp.]|nr:hypothetical protein [Bradyrhizobium sp.]